MAQYYSYIWTIFEKSKQYNAKSSLYFNSSTPWIFANVHVNEKIISLIYQSGNKYINY